MATEIAAHWRDMANAPRDGNPVLASNCQIDGGFIQVVFYDPEHSPAIWATADGMAYLDGAFTHWMPLPEPPTP